MCWVLLMARAKKNFSPKVAHNQFFLLFEQLWGNFFYTQNDFFPLGKKLPAPGTSQLTMKGTHTSAHHPLCRLIFSCVNFKVFFLVFKDTQGWTRVHASSVSSTRPQLVYFRAKLKKKKFYIKMKRKFIEKKKNKKLCTFV